MDNIQEMSKWLAEVMKDIECNNEPKPKTIGNLNFVLFQNREDWFFNINLKHNNKMYCLYLKPLTDIDKFHVYDELVEALDKIQRGIKLNILLSTDLEDLIELFITYH